MCPSASRLIDIVDSDYRLIFSLQPAHPQGAASATNVIQKLSQS